MYIVNFVVAQKGTKGMTERDKVTALAFPVAAFFFFIDIIRHPYLSIGTFGRETRAVRISTCRSEVRGVKCRSNISACGSIRRVKLKRHDGNSFGASNLQKCK